MHRSEIGFYTKAFYDNEEVLEGSVIAGLKIFFFFFFLTAAFHNPKTGSVRFRPASVHLCKSMINTLLQLFVNCWLVFSLYLCVCFKKILH